MEYAQPNKTFQRPALPYGLLLFSYLLLFSLLSLMLVLSHVLNIPVEEFTADPAVTFQAHPLTGFGSHLAAMMWCASAVICFFAAALLKLKDRLTHFNFLIWSGIISAMLFIDDLFMFHEAIFTWYFSIPQSAVYLGYVLFIMAYIYWFRKQILNSEYVLLVVALFFFASSVFGDFVLAQEGYAYLIEDGLKLFGIVTWLIYFFRVAMRRSLASDLEAG